jgi:hypothetical protein
LPTPNPALEALDAVLATGGNLEDAEQALRGQMEPWILADAILLRLDADPFGGVRALATLALAMPFPGKAITLLRRALMVHRLHPLCVALGAGSPKLAFALCDRLGVASALDREGLPATLARDLRADALVLQGVAELEAHLVRLPRDLRIIPGALRAQNLKRLRTLPEGLRVEGVLDLLRCEALVTLPPGLWVGKELRLTGCKAWDRRLPEDARVRGALSFNIACVPGQGPLTVLASGVQQVPGDVGFRHAFPDGRAFGWDSDTMLLLR